MCGIFGVVGADTSNFNDIPALAKCAEQRGKDSSGILYHHAGQYTAIKADIPITRLLRNSSFSKLKPSQLAIGHSRLITSGLSDNQPVIRDGLAVLHNGIIVNEGELWKQIPKERLFQVDSEVIAAIAAEHLDGGGSVEDLAQVVLSRCKGTASCALVVSKLGKICLFSNNGSLYVGKKRGANYFSSELYPLSKVGCTDIRQIRDDGVIFDIPASNSDIAVVDKGGRTNNIVPDLILTSTEEKLLVYPEPTFRRCTKCILPETMPYITFDENGVCNYCHNYRIRNSPKPQKVLMDLLEPFRRQTGNDCIVPFSGGRDSCYALHIIVNELKMKPVTYTYDWGMVTDLGRRNISRMCAELGVENIIVAADIELKRNNIAKNIRAWLKSPHLGMISIFTAGDKHFFRHLETIKKQTGISLNLWGASPLEVTHFKAGFLGIPPEFASSTVYKGGLASQIQYQSKRFRAMLDSPSYFNSSLFDTISGEFHRSILPKTDYFEIFDYWSWEESRVDQILAMYDWEKAEDTSTTWRIGDGTAAFYNYIYRTVAGFSEHDTFRSNQIREGQIDRDHALTLVNHENRPRFANIKWYLDAVGLDFRDTITAINAIPRLYGETAS